MKKALAALAFCALTIKAAEPEICKVEFKRLATRRFMAEEGIELCSLRPAKTTLPSLQHPQLSGKKALWLDDAILFEGDGSVIVGGFWPCAKYRLDIRDADKAGALLALRTLDASVDISAIAAPGRNVDVTISKDGKEVCKETLTATAVPAAPFSLVALAGGDHLAFYTEKNGKVRYCGDVDTLESSGFRLSEKALFSRLKFCAGSAGEGTLALAGASAELSAGIGQADVRFVTDGRSGKPYWENGRLFFTFSARAAHGHLQGVASFDPSVFDVRLEGIIVFDYGDGLWRNDIASHIFRDEDGTWKAWTSNFSTANSGLSKRAEGGLNVAESKRSPLHGLCIMQARSLGMKGMNEDPCGIWDEVEGKWRLLVSEFTPKGIRASMWESAKWDGGYSRIAGPVERDSTGTLIQTIAGECCVFSGSSDRACYVYKYPTLELLGKMRFDLPPWNEECKNGRVWPCVAELPKGYPFRYIMLTMDRVNMPGMKGPNWTYGALHFYAAE